MDLTLFYAKIDKRGPAECWPWTGARGSRGYGMWSVTKRGPDGYRRTYTASRLAHELASGEEVPPDLSVLHTCDNPPCCNPRHLWVGTALDNARDKVAKGRLRVGDSSGENNGHAVLTWEQVKDIRRRVADGPRGTQAALAREYSVSPQTICDTVKGRRWRQ